ncbi:hypothetical protein M413DRAFT_14479 [Hebeloma cylindrosporum]|uniref:Uncharacterized protein n=1 Tax=Hebeloma cylindrosporum TaxID=76867 RepID=A0A0C3BFJ9_HEBCY|nr:hypothetical protein M413DRAFT_14479 [Hebeloma cylindrosporum h7]
MTLNEELQRKGGDGVLRNLLRGPGIGNARLGICEAETIAAVANARLGGERNLEGAKGRRYGSSLLEVVHDRRSWICRGGNVRKGIGEASTGAGDENHRGSLGLILSERPSLYTAAIAPVVVIDPARTNGTKTESRTRRPPR